MKMLLKDPVKITGVVISHQQNDIFHREPCGGQKERRLIEPLYLQQVFKRVPGMALDQLADIIVRLSGERGKFLQSAGPVIVLDIFESREDQVLFILVGIVFIDLIALILQKNK